MYIPLTKGQIMKRYFYTLMMALTMSMTMQAQYVYNSNYQVWFEGTDSEMTTRKTVWCEEDYQDLWNGCYVRNNGSTIYVKDGSSTVVYGNEIGLLYNGYYTVRNGSTWYLYDSEGDKVGGVYGEEILYYPFNYVACKKGQNLWYVYRCNGEKLSFYSDVSPWICSNECWIVQQGNKQYGIGRDGYKVSGVYGDDVSMQNGRWKCVNNGYVRYIDAE